jgi:Cd2+/Zn2+-exporting ATPase
VNESPITGESSPVAKQPGDAVYAGTINHDGTIEFEVTKPAGDTTLAHIVRLVEQSQRHRAPAEQWVEQFARYYTPAMMALAAAVALIPPLLFAVPWSTWAYNGLVVLVIACPCALVISPPVTIVSAMTSATRNGVLVKGGRFLEAAAGIRAVAFDKTGTVTYGQMTVERIVPLDGHTPRELLERAAAMESHSPHPLARAILARAAAENIQVTPAEQYRIRQGLGAEGVIGGQTFWIGSHRFLHEKTVEPPEVHEAALSLEDDGHTVVAVGNDRHICGLISFADRVRAETPETVAALRALGVRHIAVLSGDNQQTTAAIARTAGVDAHFAELLPEDKVREITSLKMRFGPVAMVGDGINDAPAMAASTLGIAMGAIGSDAAIETADVALMTDDIARLPWLMSHARRMMTVIRQNVAFALGLKALFVLLTLAGAASLWSAIAADTGASLLVIFNGMRLLKP